LKADSSAYQYPPLWGAHSYNQGAGLFRMSRFAGYVKANMPLGATWDAPQLTDEEAWDVAAYVNSQPRPKKDIRADWPDISSKPFDHPFGPFADGFSAKQHKFGPFGPIKAKLAALNAQK
jgi:thiosulfate dehydrogenase